MLLPGVDKKARHCNVYQFLANLTTRLIYIFISSLYLEIVIIFSHILYYFLAIYILVQQFNNFLKYGRIERRERYRFGRCHTGMARRTL